MPRALSIATVQEKNKLASEVPFLLLLDITVLDPATGNVVEHLYLANNAEDFPYQGNTYLATAFTLGLQQESGAQPQVSLTITDYSNFVQQRMQDYQGAVGFPVTAMLVPATQGDKPPEVVEYFEIIGSGSQNYVCSFTLGSENALAKTFPRRRQMRDFCAWAYKGAQCKYAGSATTCDLTLKGPNGCEAHNNSVNFGGFPGISAGARYG